jgi:hypothetical protein
LVAAAEVVGTAAAVMVVGGTEAEAVPAWAGEAAAHIMAAAGTAVAAAITVVTTADGDAAPRTFS